MCTHTCAHARTRTRTHMDRHTCAHTRAHTGDSAGNGSHVLCKVLQCDTHTQTSKQSYSSPFHVPGKYFLRKQGKAGSSPSPGSLAARFHPLPGGRWSLGVSAATGWSLCLQTPRLTSGTGECGFCPPPPPQPASRGWEERLREGGASLAAAPSGCQAVREAAGTVVPLTGRKLRAGARAESEHRRDGTRSRRTLPLPVLPGPAPCRLNNSAG